MRAEPRQFAPERRIGLLARREQGARRGDRRRYAHASKGRGERRATRAERAARKRGGQGRDPPPRVQNA